MSKQFRVLSIAVIAVLFVTAGCGANPRQSRQMIVGRWVLAEGSGRDIAERLEYLADGTGLSELGREAMTFQWRIDDDNRIISTAMNGSRTQIYTIREISRTTLIVEWQGVRITYKTPQETERLARRNIQHRSGTFTDSRNGQTYRTVKIGNKTWMAENLNFQTDNSWCYDNNSANCSKYGRLYTWDAAMKACPSGWRLPNDNDWDALMTAVGSTSNDHGNGIVVWDGAGTKLKSASGWNTGSGYIPGTDDFVFSALPGGHRFTDGSFDDVGDNGRWWSAAEDGASRARGRGMGYDLSNVDSNWYFKSHGFSVRCSQD